MAFLSLMVGILAGAAMAAVCLVFIYRDLAGPSNHGLFWEVFFACIQVAVAASATGVTLGIVALRSRSPRRAWAMGGIFLSVIVLAALGVGIAFALQFKA